MMTRIRKPTQKTPAPLKIISLSLTEFDAGALQSLAQTASDQIGRRISLSAVVRGMLSLYAVRRVPEQALIEAIAGEVAGGRIWGTTPRPQHGAERTKSGSRAR